MWDERYDLWDDRYDIPDYVYGTEPNQFLKEHAHLLPVGDTLCLAEGEGRNGVYLAELGHRVLGVDGSSVGLQKAGKLAASRKVSIKTEVADLSEYVIAPKSWDAIVSIYCHVPLHVRERLHRQVVTGLKPGGVFLLLAYTPRQLRYNTGGPQQRELLMELVSLKHELAGLTFIHAIECEQEIQEGGAHTGTSAVVQLIGRK